MPIIHAVEALGTNVKYGDAPQTDVSFKVIADHIRALSLQLVMVRFLQMKVVAMCYVVYYVAVMHGKKLGINEAFYTN